MDEAAKVSLIFQVDYEVKHPQSPKPQLKEKPSDLTISILCIIEVTAASGHQREAHGCPS